MARLQSMPEVCLRIAKKVSRIAKLVVVPAVCVGLAGCETPGKKVEKVENSIVVVDITTKEIPLAVAQRAVRKISVRGIKARKSITLCQIDSHAGATCATTFTPTVPVSEAVKYISNWEQEQAHAAEQLFASALQAIYNSPPPRSSPIIASIITAVSGRNGPVDLFILSDMRETVAWNMERGKLPTIEQWHDRLVKAGLLEGYLTGVSIKVVGMPLTSASDPPAMPGRGLKIQELFKELLEFGANSVEFVDEKSLGFLIFPMSIGFTWRKFQAKRIGRGDAKINQYSPTDCIEHLLGEEPPDDREDPEVADTHEAVKNGRIIIGKLKTDIAALKRRIARQPSWCPRIVGIAIFGGIDVVSSSQLARDIGMVPPNNWMVGVALASGLVFLAWVAGKGMQVSAQKPVSDELAQLKGLENETADKE